jgi:hypothetical protein
MTRGTTGNWKYRVKRKLAKELMKIEILIHRYGC